MDIYRDYFTREELVRTLAQAEFQPGMLGADKIFEVVPLGATTFGIEVTAKDGKKTLTAIARGAPRQQTKLDPDAVKTFVTQTFGDEGTVYADEVLNARGRGTVAVKALIEDRRARLVTKLRGVMDTTHELLRMNAILSPGTTEFGAQGTEQTILLGTDTTKTRQEIFNKITKPVETALDGISYKGIRVYCSDGFWAELIENKQIKDTYNNWQAAADLRNGLVKPFTFGDVEWVRYRGSSAIAVTASKAVVVPQGVDGFGFMGFAPNDTVESVGQGGLGEPYFLGAKELTDSQGTKGWEISIQSHPKVVVGRPAATFLVKLT